MNWCSRQGENDNISTVYVLDENDKFYGAIDLKDLIVARQQDNLEVSSVLLIRM